MISQTIKETELHENENGSIHYCNLYRSRFCNGGGSSSGFAFARVFKRIALPEASEPIVDYLFDVIGIPGVEFLEVTASNDLRHYAGNTRSPDGGENHRFYTD